VSTTPRSVGVRPPPVARLPAASAVPLERAVVVVVAVVGDGDDERRPAAAAALLATVRGDGQL